MEPGGRTAHKLRGEATSLRCPPPGTPLQPTGTEERHLVPSGAGGRGKETGCRAPSGGAAEVRRAMGGARCDALREPVMELQEWGAPGEA